MPEQLKQTAAAPGALELNDFESLLKKEFKPKSDTASSAIKTAVRTLAEQALIGTTKISGDALKSIEEIIKELDRKLSEQVNLIMHHEKFKELEGTWRGLHHLVSNTETDKNLKIKVYNVSKKELGKTLRKTKGAQWDQSAIFKQIYEEGFGVAGGEPFGALIGDYFFDHSPADVELLQGVAQIAAAAHAPFISGTSPSLLNMDSWQELSNPRDLAKIFQSAEYAPWRSLRASDDSRYLALAMPRFLSRLPYGEKNPTEGFVFEEDTAGTSHDKFAWSNAAYTMGVNITRAFKLYGWCARIRGRESGGLVEGLPCHTFPTDDGGVDMKCPTEIAISDRREAELAGCGLMPLLHWKNTDTAVFVGAQTLHEPEKYDDPDASANAQLGARLPYLFASCRFAHYLKVMVRDKIGSFKGREDMVDWLTRWIMQYVTTDKTASEEVKAEKPLAAAEVSVEEIPGNPGYYTAKFHLLPHYQLEGLTVSLRLVTKLPSAKAAG